MNQKLALGYQLEFSRKSNNLSFSNDDTIFKNIITIDIKNNIGILLYSIRMNEGDCIRLLDYITAYLYDFFDWGDTCDIKLSLSTTTATKYPIIHFQNITKQINENENNVTYYNRSLEEYRYHEMSILEADMNNPNSMMKILTIPMSSSEVEEFVYMLYFNGLMDLVLPEELLNKLDEIIARIFGENWFNWG